MAQEGNAVRSIKTSYFRVTMKLPKFMINSQQFYSSFLMCFVLCALLPRLWLRIKSSSSLSGCAALLLALVFLHSPVGYAAEATSGAVISSHIDRETPGAEKLIARHAPLPAWVDVSVEAPDNVVQSPLTIRLSDVQIYVDQAPVIYVHRVMKVNDASMLATLARVEIVFQPDYQQVSLHTLRIVRGGSAIDKTDAADIRFLQREQELDAGIYTGSVTASIVIDDIRVGDTLDIAYSITGQNPVFGGKFFQTVSWDSTIPTQRKRVTLNAPADRAIAARYIGGAGNAPAPVAREQKSGDRKIVRFAQDGVVPVDFEPYVPADIDQFREIQFSEFSSWRQVAQWAATLFDAAGSSSSAAVTEAIAPMRDIADPDQRVQRALEYVQSKIRYLSVSLGENSHKPFPPDQVLARRYGDCKDKALLLTSMLRQLGIEAAPVLVSMSSRKELNRLLPTPLAFDHAIVRAVTNGKIYFLDPTRSTQYGPLARMGQSHAGDDALVVKAETDRLISIVAEDDKTMPSNSRIERAVVSKVDGPADLTVLHKYSGLEAEAVRYFVASQSKEQLRKAYIAAVASRYPSAELVAGPIVADKREENALSIEMRYRIPGFLEKESDGWTVRYQASNLRERFYMPESPRRNFPLAVSTEPVNSLYEFELTLPENFDATYSPSNNKVSDAAFSASERLMFNGNVIQASVALNMLADRVSSKAVPDFMADARKFGNMIDGSVRIRKSDLKGGKLQALLDAPLKQRIVEREEKVVSDISRAIVDGRTRNDADGADSLCQRGLAYAHLGRKTEAMADIRAAMGDGRSSGELLRCRAEIAYFGGDMKGSEADFAQVAALGINDATTCFQHAMVNYSLGKWHESAEGFAQAFERYEDPQDKARAEIMRAISLRRLNPHVRSETYAIDEDDWPGITLAAVDGSKSEDDVLRQVHRRLDDELEIALSDAYYYLGQINLLVGNKLKAAVYLQRMMDKGVLSSAYRPAARLEIERLRK